MDKEDDTGAVVSIERRRCQLRAHELSHIVNVSKDISERAAKSIFHHPYEGIFKEADEAVKARRLCQPRLEIEAEIGIGIAGEELARLLTAGSLARRLIEGNTNSNRSNR